MKKSAKKNEYADLGAFSLIIGGFFMTLTVITTMTVVRIAVFSFFLFMGAIDLIIYSIFGKNAR